MLDYPPRATGPLFQLPAKKKFWKAPTDGSHRTCILDHLVTPTQRSVGSKCAHAPFQGPTI